MKNKTLDPADKGLPSGCGSPALVYKATGGHKTRGGRNGASADATPQATTFHHTLIDRSTIRFDPCVRAPVCPNKKHIAGCSRPRTTVTDPDRLDRAVILRSIVSITAL